MIACPVRPHCRAAAHCPWCVEGSEYLPDQTHTPHPARVAAQKARRAARRIHRHLPTTLRGAANRRHGQKAEQFFARRLHGTVNRGSGRFDSAPNDVYLPGWQCEIRERRGQFGRVHQALRQHDGLLLPGAIAIIPYPVFAIYHPSHPSDPWTLPEWWTWKAYSTTQGWTTLITWIHDPREHPDVVIVRTGIHPTGHDAFAVFLWHPHP